MSSLALLFLAVLVGVRIWCIPNYFQVNYIYLVGAIGGEEDNTVEKTPLSSTSALTKYLARYGRHNTQHPILPFLGGKI